MKTPRIDRTATRRGRGIVLFVAGALAMGLGIVGVHAAIAGGSSQDTRHVPTAPVAPIPSAVPEPVSRPDPAVAPAQPSPTAEPTPDPTALSDGVYPTFVRGVDVQGATVTVDVLQTFFGEAALTAAREDDVAIGDVIYEPVYIRNENPLLRTLPVSRHVRVEFIGGCESPNRWVGLTQLRKDTTPYTETFYYEVTVVDGTVILITQKIAISAC